MAQPNEDIIDLVKTLVLYLVEDHEAVEVSGFEEDNGIHIDIAVAEDEVGKIIGRQGRVIKAIRTLVRAAASQAGLNAEVEILG